MERERGGVEQAIRRGIGEGVEGAGIIADSLRPIFDVLLLAGMNRRNAGIMGVLWNRLLYAMMSEKQKEQLAH